MNNVLFVLLACMVFASCVQAQATIPFDSDNAVKASSAYRTYSPDKLLDMNSLDNWMSEGYTTGEGGVDRTPWLIFTFDDVYTVDSVTIQNFYGGENVRGARYIDVYASLDGTFAASPMTAAPLFSIDLEKNGPDWVNPPLLPHEQTFDFPEGVQALAVMLVIKTNWYGYTFSPDAPPTDWANVSTVGLNGVYFTGTPVPEPATMTLLALGGLALLRRRR